MSTTEALLARRDVLLAETPQSLSAYDQILRDRELDWIDRELRRRERHRASQSSLAITTTSLPGPVD